jgi:hypothetical protein
MVTGLGKPRKKPVGSSKAADKAVAVSNEM